MSDRRLLDRRQFLVASSACAVATTVLGPNLFAANARANDPRLAVGFARVEEKAALVPASSIPSSDGAFISKGARIAVSGANDALAPIARRSVELLTYFPYLEGASIESALFHAWGSSRITGAQGSPIRFTVPVDHVQKIDMTLIVESGDRIAGAPASRRRAIGGGTSSTNALPVSFALQDDPSSVKLVRGFYVLAPLFDGDAEPSWSNFHLHQRDGRWTLVDAAGSAATFEHLVLHIGYAMA